MSKNPFLKRAYRLKNQQDTLSMYGDWAATYDQTMKDHDYQSPRRIVEALLRHCADKYVAIFDGLWHWLVRYGPCQGGFYTD